MLKKIFQVFGEIIQVAIIAFIIVFPIRYFLFQPFLVQGNSMEPNFHQNDYLIVDEISYRFRQPKRGEVIVFKYPGNPKYRYIKRIIGLPGEEVIIEDGKVLINGQILDESEYLPQNTQTPGYFYGKLGANEYFVLGDNRNFSSDSRRWGPLPQKNIVGRVIFRLFPLRALAKIEAPNYSLTSSR